ncbi:MAG: futalosine hydrolase [Armatimonadota bacterium]|nr:futalosine hydrolase [Armatimonadota bacterium]
MSFNCASFSPFCLATAQSGVALIDPTNARGTLFLVKAPTEHIPGAVLLVCAATLMELRTFAPALAEEELERGVVRQENALLLVTGVGIPSALVTVLQTCLRERPARILNIGIAGAYPGSKLAIGDIVMAESEVYGDVGMELPAAPGFQPLRETPWGASYATPFPLASDPHFTGDRTAPGCTVNACAGTDETGRRRAQQFGAAFETMEGAAVAQVGQTLGIPVCEIRAISNFAAHRDMRPENIRLALRRLADFLKTCRETNRA